MNAQKCIICLFFVIQCFKEGFFDHEDDDDDDDDDDESSLIRNKRYLLFPVENTFNLIQVIIGVGIPVDVKPESVILGWGARAIYSMPSNLSLLQYSDYGATRKKRHLSRWDVYKMLEQEAESRGYEGRPCVLRSICQAADIPLDRNHGLFEELLHSIFTPTSTNEDIDHHTDNEYIAAQTLGRKNKGKCDYFFPECEASLIDMFTHQFSDSPI